MYVLIRVPRDATQSSLFIILQVRSTRFGCQPHPSSGVHKTVTTASGTGHIFVQLPPSNVAKLAWKRWTSTGGCSYSFVHSYVYIYIYTYKVINSVLLCLSSALVVAMILLFVSYYRNKATIFNTKIPSLNSTLNQRTVYF